MSAESPMPRVWRTRRSAGHIAITTGMPGRDLEVLCIVETEDNPEAEADAEMIVRAVNAHDELVAALREAAELTDDRNHECDPSKAHEILCAALEKAKP